MDSECASGCIWSMHGQQPVSGTADPGVVKQDKSSRGSVDATKTRSAPQRVRMSSGDRPIGAAKGKQSDTEALCQPPPPQRPKIVRPGQDLEPALTAGTRGQLFFFKCTLGVPLDCTWIAISYCESTSLGVGPWCLQSLTLAVDEFGHFWMQLLN